MQYLVWQLFDHLTSFHNSELIVSRLGNPIEIFSYWFAYPGLAILPDHLAAA
jgi:hypothetical protein